MKFDVVIVGGGPAGLFAARELEKDYSVALIEKKQSIGSYGNRIVNRDVFSKLRVGRDCVISEIEKISFVSPSGLRLAAAEGKRGFVISKERVQKDIFGQLGKTSVFLGTEVQGVDLKGRKVHAAGKAFSFGTLLGADGVGSAIRSFVSKENPMTVKCQFGLFERGSEETSCIISNTLAPGFYGWSIDMGKIVEIGMGASEEHQADFEGFVKRFFPSAGRLVERKSGVLAKTCVGKRVFNDCILIGDATGGEPLMGSSIHKSIDEAMIASEVIRKGDDVSSYEGLWEERFGNEFASEEAARLRLQKKHDSEIDAFFQKKKSLSGEGLVTGLLKELIRS